MASAPASPSRPGQGTQHSSTQAPAPKPPVPPVNINNSSSTARIYSFAHPTMLVALYSIRFPSLVADPVNRLLNDLPLLAILQIAYVMVCLPPAGSAPSTTSLLKSTGTTGGDGDGEGEGAKNVKRTPGSAPSSPGGSGFVLKQGKIAHRRKQSHYHRNDGRNISAKLMVCN